MTRDYRDRQRRETPFSRWLRLYPELDSKYGYDGEDIDGTQRFIWHQYRRGYLRLLEIKCGDAVQSYAQRDTQSIIDQALRFAFTHPAFSLKRENPRRPIRIRYLGYSLVQFERSCPDDGRIHVDGKPMTTEEFIRFLKFEDIQEIEQRDYIHTLLEEIGRALDAQKRWDGDERDEWEEDTYDGS
jgi:hypothetical protein